MTILLTSWEVKLEPAIAEGWDSATVCWACHCKGIFKGGNCSRPISIPRHLLSYSAQASPP